MEKSIFEKGLIIGIILLFVGTSIIPVTSSHSTIQNYPKSLTITNLKIENSSKDIKQFQLVKFFPYINGTGKTSTELTEMNDSFKFILKFDFINAEAVLSWGFLDLPLWEWFPLIFNLVGPHSFKAVGFSGDIQKIDDEYHIEGHCLVINGGNL